jgi:hypothetical protein
MENLQLISVILLNLFLVTATVDGLYFHLWKYKLHLRPDSIYEHKLHTARAFLFIPIIFFLFFKDFGGIALWFGILFILLDLAVEMLDVFNEKSSRASLGGLSSLEYAAHIIATTFRVPAILLILVAKPASAWSFSSPFIIGNRSNFLTLTAINTIVGNFIVGILHLLLMSKTFRNLKLLKCCNG